MKSKSFYRVFSVFLLLLLILGGMPVLAQDAASCEEGFRLFEHEYLGSEPVCIPENPQRIAVLDLAPLEVVLTQGIQPVAMYGYGRDLIARSNPGINVDIMGLTADTADVGDASATNLELLLASDPDLIIITAYAASTTGLETFQEIAPTVVFAMPLDKGEYRSSVEFTSAVLNLPEAGETLLSQLDARLADFREALGEPAEPPEISLVRVRDAIVLWAAGSFADHLIHEAGLVRPEQQREFDLEYVETQLNGRVGFEVSEEELPLIDGENIILWTASPSSEIEEEARQLIATLDDDPLWNTLSAFQNERVFVVGSHWQGFGILEAHTSLDDLFRYIAGVDPQEVSPNPFLAPEAAIEATAVPEAESTAEASSASFPLTFTHSLGTIEIAAQPQRIVALGIGDIATVYGLGLTPVAISANPYSPDGLWPWLDGMFDPAQTVLMDFGAPSFEQVVELSPDIILATNLFNITDLYSSLSEIAPTTAPVASTSLGSTWQAQTLYTGQTLGMEAEAQALVDETERQIADVVANHLEIAGKTFSLSYLHSPDALGSINSPSDYAVQFFQSLGFVVTPALAELAETQEGVQAALSLETMNLIDADLVVLAFGSPEVQAGYEANPLYQQIPAVQAGRVVVVDLNVVTQLRGPNVLGIRWVLEQLEPAFSLLQ